MERVVQFETKQKTSPGIDMYSFTPMETLEDPTFKSRKNRISNEIGHLEFEIRNLKFKNIYVFEGGMITQVLHGCRQLVA